MDFVRRQLKCGAYLNVLQTDKFKKNYISVNFAFEHNESNAALSSLLSDVLTRATKKYPSLRDVERELDECYGASLSSYTTVKGSYKILTVSIDCLDDHYAFDGEQLFRRSIDMLSEVLFFPLVENGSFCEEYVDSEKEKLLASIARRNNSKRHYASDRCKSIMCKGEPCGIAAYGSVDAVKRIDARSLYEFYNYMLSESSIEIFYVGSRSLEDVSKPLENMLGSIDVDRHTFLSYPQKLSVSEPRRVFEDAEYKQSVLVMGYRTNVNSEDDCKYAFILFNSLFGSGVNSKLFRVVREQMHLCYYASCAPDLSSSVAYVTSGIDVSNEKKAQDAIVEQLDAVVRGDFTDDDISDCKKSILNAYRELYDSAEGLCGWYLGRVIYGDNGTIDDTLKRILNVSRDEVIEVAQKMQLDTVYVLRGTAKSADGGSDE
ncbi:MAG: insulinase family protein [Clostridia bacterium]|nr:insulinase family protein [Clostridia bacterium]